MIKLTRTTEPPTAFAGEQRIEKNLALIDLRRRGGKPDSNVWRRAKAHLKAETHGKCAYCESSTSTVAYGDVEHFRPKSVYWWLAYCYDNFSYSCQLCNQMYKGATFRVAREDHRWQGPVVASGTGITDREQARLMTPDPRDRAAGMPSCAFVQAVTREKPYLVDPYLEDPEELYKWEADAVLEEVRITARTTRVRARRAIRAAQEDLGLNREELRRRRWHNYRILRTLASVVEELAAQPARYAAARTRAITQIETMMAADSEYAGMARYFVRIEWRLDITSPDERAE